MPRLFELVDQPLRRDQSVDLQNRVRPAIEDELERDRAVRGFVAPGTSTCFEEALRVEGLADAIDVFLQLEEVELVAFLDLDLRASGRDHLRIAAGERDRADQRLDAPLGRRPAVAATERDLVADAETDRAAVARQRAQLDVAAWKVADHERRLAVLTQVLRHRELDLIAQALAQGQSGRRVGPVVADQRRVFAEVGILELAALDAEGVEANRAARDAKQIGRQQRQRGFGVAGADDLRGDLTRGARAFLGCEIDARPLERAGQRHRDVVAVQSRFGGDVEFGVDVAAIGERDVAARDAEGVTRKINLSALAQRDAAVHAWLRDGADHVHAGAGREAAVVVVDEQIFGGGDRQVELQPIEIRAAAGRRHHRQRGLPRESGDRDRVGIGALDDADVAGQRRTAGIGTEGHERIQLAAQPLRHFDRNTLRLDVELAAGQRERLEFQRAIEREGAAIGQAAHAVNDRLLAVEDDGAGQFGQDDAWFGDRELGAIETDPPVEAAVWQRCRRSWC